MKTNKHLLIFAGLLALLAVSYSFAIVKFLPILIHHTLYYCKEMVSVMSLNLLGDLGDVILGLFVFFIVFTLLKLLITALRVFKFRQFLSLSVVNNHKFADVFKSLKLDGKVIILHEYKPLAYCFGIREPKIYITTGLLSLVESKELKVILRHEKYHLEHHDNLTLLLATFIESLFPFFPILKDFTRIYRTDRELLADRASIENETDKQLLSSTLRKLLQYESPALPSLAPAIADSDTLESRIRSLISMKVVPQRLDRRNVFISLVSALSLIGMIATPVNAVELHKEGLDAIMVCNQKLSCESTCGNKGSTTTQGIQQSSTFVNFSSNY